mgnify:CR=1 FL=1
MDIDASVTHLGAVVARRHNKAAAFPGAAVHGFNDGNHFLLVGQSPVDLVVVAGSLYLIGEFRKLLVGEVVG